jgi:hypothetical protein
MDICRTVYDCAVIKFPTFADDRGNLSFFETSRHVPFELKRTYWIYDVPGGECRGEHAFRSSCECVIALSGSFDVHLDDGVAQKIISLNRAFYGVYIPSMIWRSLRNFSTNAVAFVVSSTPYQPQDYIDVYEDYKKLNSH